MDYQTGYEDALNNGLKTTRDRGHVTVTAVYRSDSGPHRPSRALREASRHGGHRAKRYEGGRGEGDVGLLIGEARRWDD